MAHTDPEKPEERVFDADFLSKSSFFRARQQLEVAVDVTPPAVVFWVLLENGKGGSAFAVNQGNP